MLKVDFGSRSQSRVPDVYSTFVKKSTLSWVNRTSTRLHFSQALVKRPKDFVLTKCMSHNFSCLLFSTCTRSQPTAVWRMHNNLLTRQGSDQLGPAKATLLLYNHFIVLYHWGVTVETIVKKLQLPNQCLIELH